MLAEHCWCQSMSHDIWALSTTMEISPWFNLIAALVQIQPNVLVFNLDESYSDITATLITTKEELSLPDVTGALVNKEGRRDWEIEIRRIKRIWCCMQEEQILS